MDKTRTESTIGCLDFSIDLNLKYPKYFALADRAIDIHTDVFSYLHKKSAKMDDIGCEKRIYAWQSFKATECLISLSKLVDSGLVGDGTTICRKLLEQAITVLYIAQKPIPRAKMFSSHQALNRPFFMQQALKSNYISESEKSRISNMLQLALDQLSEARDEFGIPETEKTVPPKYRYDWSGRKLESMAEEVGLGWEYFKLYRLFSQEVHSGNSNQMRYLDVEKAQFCPKYGIGEALGALFFGIKWYLSILEVFGKSVGFHSAEIMTIRNELESLENAPEFSSDELLFTMED